MFAAGYSTRIGGVDFRTRCTLIAFTVWRISSILERSSNEDRDIFSYRRVLETICVGLQLLKRKCYGNIYRARARLFITTTRRFLTCLTRIWTSKKKIENALALEMSRHLIDNNEPSLESTSHLCSSYLGKNKWFEGKDFVAPDLRKLKYLVSKSKTNAQDFYVAIINYVFESPQKFGSRLENGIMSSSCLDQLHP
ncbi:hypothetical protein RRG08_036767 [Elysia crispata]|uniref:Uncharacterized protein n=1 Tax=Elysia crispata TaxID=231223 RepID=A0AAE0Y917_9GAST|nr:hypothetical protein RRG08_036767 [Elysia crispata]